jgi:formyl-CoA transferase
MGGLMSITGLPGQGPVRVGVPIADLGAGIFCAIGILIALLEREVSGEGQWVQSSLLQAQIALLDFQAARWLIANEVPGQAGNDHPTSIPTGVFPTRDGHINIAGSGAHIYKRLCVALNAEHLVDDPRFATDAARSKNRAALNAAIARVTRHKSSAEWIALLNETGVPCGPIYKMDEVFADPQVRHIGMATAMRRPKLGDTEVVNQPVALSRTPSNVRLPTPEKGEHTQDVLREFGYDDAKIAALRRRQVI